MKLATGMVTASNEEDGGGRVVGSPKAHGGQRRRRGWSWSEFKRGEALFHYLPC